MTVPAAMVGAEEARMMDTERGWVHVPRLRDQLDRIERQLCGITGTVDRKLGMLHPSAWRPNKPTLVSRVGYFVAGAALAGLTQLWW